MRPVTLSEFFQYGRFHYALGGSGQLDPLTYQPLTYQALTYQPSERTSAQQHRFFT